MTSVNHIILTVSDPVRAQAFYGDLLGFELSIEENGGFNFMAGDVWVFVYPSQKPQAGDRFSEFRIGLDHLAFTSESRTELDKLAKKLMDAGVETKGVEVFEPTGNYYVAFRDPDNIQLEYWLP